MIPDDLSISEYRESSAGSAHTRDKCVCVSVREANRALAEATFSGSGQTGISFTRVPRRRARAVLLILDPLNRRGCWTHRRRRSRESKHDLDPRSNSTSGARYIPTIIYITLY